MAAVQLAPSQDVASEEWPIPLTTCSPGRARDRSAGGYRRRRAGALCVVVVGVAAVWFALQAALGGAGSVALGAAGTPSGVVAGVRLGATDAGARVWVVRPGDTLWTIALSSGARGDIRPYVDRLAAETGGASLQVGERVPLP